MMKAGWERLFHTMSTFVSATGVVSGSREGAIYGLNPDLNAMD
jgi:hypothetical protein